MTQSTLCRYYQGLLGGLLFLVFNLASAQLDTSLSERDNAALNEIRAMIQAGNTREALEQLDQLQERIPNSAEPALLKGVALTLISIHYFADFKITTFSEVGITLCLSASVLFSVTLIEKS